MVDASSAVTLPLTGKLWELSPVINGQGDVRNVQLMNESTSVQSGNISFADGPSYSDRRNHSIGLSIEGAGDTGPLFRSGPFDSLPPGAPADPRGLIEILVPPSVRITTADLAASLPPLPISLRDGITLTGLTLVFGTGSMTLTATGTKAIPVLPPVGFTYTLTFDVVPSFEMWDLTTVFDVVPLGPGILAPPIVAALAGVLGTTEAEVRLRVIRTLQRVLSDSALAAAAAAVGATSLPMGLVLSVRRTVITPSGIAIFPSVGAFGGIVNSFLGDLSDGTLLKEQNNPAIFVIFGGAKFFIPDPATFEALGFDWARVRTIPDGALAAVGNLPHDGTVLRELSSAAVFVIIGGQKSWIPDPDVLRRFGGWAVVRVVPDGSLAGIPTGPQVPQAPSAQCMQIQADIAQRRGNIHTLEQARTNLNPRDPLDRGEIRHITVQINIIRNEISALEQQAAALGCP
jgi:hypothetical protein